MIASSPTDVGPVLKAIVESACELCDAYDAVVLLKDGDDLRISAHHGPIPIGHREVADQPRAGPPAAPFVDKTPVHIARSAVAEKRADFPMASELSRRRAIARILSVPLLRENESIGAIMLRRTEVHPFSDKQIALLQTFADQAVIAIENVRLFEEVQANTRDLTESLQQQTATADVLEVISRSPGELEPVFQKMLENATRICGANFGTHDSGGDGVITACRRYNVPSAYADASDTKSFRPPPKRSLGHVIATKAGASLADCVGPVRHISRAIRACLDGRRLRVRGHSSPCRCFRETKLIGIITIYRQEVRPFTDKQIELVEELRRTGGDCYREHAAAREAKLAI